MQPVNVPEWKAGVRGRAFRELIAYKIARQDAKTRDLAIDGTFDLLPTDLRGDVQDQAQAIAIIGHTTAFWGKDCAEVYEWIEKLTRAKCAERGIHADDETLFNAFEITCLWLTREVETNPKVRRVSGIRRGRSFVTLALLIALGAAAYFLLV